MRNKGVFIVSPELHLKNDAVDVEEALDAAGHGRYNYLLLFACCITHLGSVVDMLGFSVVIPAAVCDLQLSLSQHGMLTSVSFAGFLFALPWGYYADTRGRRKAIIISSTVGFILALLTSFSTNFLMMLILKFIGCSFSTASLTLTTTYLGECTQKKHRSKFILLQNCFCLAADVLCFGLAYVFLPLDFNLPFWSKSTYRPWRLLSLTLATPLGLGVMMIAFLYESPKFLVNKGEKDKALEVLKSVYKINGGSKEFFPVKVLIGDNKVDENISFWESLVNQTVPIFKKPMLWRTLQLFYLLTICCATNNVFFLWFPTLVNSFYYSSIDGNTTQKFCQRIIITTTTTDISDTCHDETPINTIYAGLLFSIFFVALNLAVIKVSSWRKSLLTATFIISGCGAILVNLFEDQIATIVLFSMIQFTGLCIGTVGSYFIDMYPTSYRGLAISLGMMVARMACLGGVNLVAATIVDHCQLTFFCWAVFVLSGIIAAMVLPSDVTTNRKT